MSRPPEVLLYSTRFCPYCIRAKMLLKRKSVSYKNISVDANSKRWQEMEQRSHRFTVPQIFIGDYHVGGYTELAELNRTHQLDDLLTGKLTKPS